MKATQSEALSTVKLEREEPVVPSNSPIKEEPQSASLTTSKSQSQIQQARENKKRQNNTSHRRERKDSRSVTKTSKRNQHKATSSSTTKTSEPPAPISAPAFEIEELIPYGKAEEIIGSYLPFTALESRIASLTATKKYKELGKAAELHLVQEVFLFCLYPYSFMVKICNSFIILLNSTSFILFYLILFLVKFLIAEYISSERKFC